MKTFTTPKQGGYQLLSDFGPCNCVKIYWPENSANWRDGCRPAQEAFLNVAKTIAATGTKACVGVNDVGAFKAAGWDISDPRIEIFKSEHANSWAQDTDGKALVNSGGGGDICFT